MKGKPPRSLFSTPLSADGSIASQVIDKDRKGWIDASYLRQLLTTKGKMPFRPTEIDGTYSSAVLSSYVRRILSHHPTSAAFMQIASDDGRIYYEDYVALLTGDTERARAGESN